MDDYAPIAATFFRDFNEQIPPFNVAACAAARDKWNAVAKPIGALGQLEHNIAQIAGVVGTPDFALSRRLAIIMCADNGVVAQGVTQCGSEVTRAVAESIARNTSSVCTMARPHHIDTIAVDVGMLEPSSVEGVYDFNIARGTMDMTQGPAMTLKQAFDAVCKGVTVACANAMTYDILIAGEMGIGNTTPASALTSVLTGMHVDEVTGRGAGLDDAGLARKCDAINRAIAFNEPDPADPLSVLAKVGSLDIAGMAGLYIGAARSNTPIVVDGFISLVAAYIATLLVPRCATALIASHASTEPAVQLLQRLVAEQFARACEQEGAADLGLRYATSIDAGMHLGEGTGAVCLIPLLDSALALYNGTTFAATGIDAYDPDLKA